MSTVTIKITEGEIKGNVYETPNGKTYYSFTGIPYAKPPTGKLRFKEPVPIEKWTNVVDATKEDNYFIQFNPLDKSVGGSESLILNVYSPSLKQGENPKPVMVYFHPGGFMVGSPRKEECGPEYLVEKDIVVVCVQYRLNLFGFLSLDIAEAPGNSGLKDQVLSLKWVQRNIGIFNGDPSNVTIFGSSAGGASVEYHVLSPLSKGLFHKAIVMSGSALNHWAIHYSPVYYAFELAKSLGKNAKDKNELLTYLQTAPAEELLIGSSKLYLSSVGGIKTPFGPTVEKKFDNVSCFLDEKPINILKSGRQNITPLIIGFGEFEGLLMTIFFPDTITAILSKESFSARLPFEVKYNDDIKKFDMFYIKNASGKINKNEAIDFFGDADFTGGILVSAKLHAAKNPNVYVYKYTNEGAYNSTRFFAMGKKPETGGSHIDPDGYIFSRTSFKPEETAKDREMRERSLELWTQFAKTGNPTPTKTDLIKSEWLPFTKNHDINILNMGSELVMEKNIEKERLNLWRRLHEYPQK